MLIKFSQMFIVRDWADLLKPVIIIDFLKTYLAEDIFLFPNNDILWGQRKLISLEQRELLFCFFGLILHIFSLDHICQGCNVFFVSV